MGASTLYDIRLRYMLEDKVAKPAKSVDRALRNIDQSSRLASRGLARVGAAAVGFVGLRAAKRALIDYNDTMEQARTTTAGLIMTTTGADWANSLSAARDIVGELEERAKSSTATTAEMVGFAREVTQPLLASGMAWKDIAEFSANSVVAAKAFGDEGIAAMDIQQALNQGVQVRDRFARKLLGTIKMTKEEFNELGKAERIDVLKKAVGSKGIQTLAKQQAGTFSGVMSTFQDQLQIGLGRIGLPLFKALTAEVRGWNKWLEANKQTVTDMGSRLAKGLVSAFGTIKNVVSFFVDHADTLIMVAKVWAGVKIGKMAGGLAGGFVQTLGKIATGMSKHSMGLGKVGQAAGVVAPGLQAVAAGLSRFLPVVGGVTAAFFALHSLTKKELTEKQRRNKAEGLTAAGAVARMGEKRASATRAVAELDGVSSLSQGDLDRTFGIDKIVKKHNIRGSANRAAGFKPGTRSDSQKLELRRARQTLDGGEEAFRQAQTSLLEWAVENRLTSGNQRNFRIDFVRLQKDFRDKMGLSTREWATLGGEINKLQRDVRSGKISLSSLFQKDADDAGIPVIPDVDTDSASSKPKVNVTIQRLEVKSDDPDRWVHQLQSAVDKIARDPSQARSSLRLNR